MERTIKLSSGEITEIIANHFHAYPFEVELKTESNTALTISAVISQKHINVLTGDDDDIECAM